MGIPLTAMLYAVHDPDIAVYRDYIEAPLNGEPAVHEELFHLSADPGEVTNLAADPKHAGRLAELRKAWRTVIVSARGESKPKVLRYTSDSQMEGSAPIEPKKPERILPIRRWLAAVRN